MYNIGDIFYEDEKYGEIAEFCNNHGYVIVEYEPDEKGRRFQIQMPPEPTQEEQDEILSAKLKAELAKIKEDIEQETFGIVRDDYAEKRARAAEIINELRVLEGMEPREVQK